VTAFQDYNHYFPFSADCRTPFMDF